MNNDNVVLVRAMNHLPFDGELVPSCEDKYLKLDESSDYYYEIRKIIQNQLEQELGRDLILFAGSEDSKILDNLVKDYVTYSSYYTSTLSFSLNGMVPDDINNNFSSMKVAVIDPIKNHLDADFVNIDVIDTTIKGRREVSTEAILVIDSNLFNSLSEDEKNNLSNNYKIELFDGSLRDAVHNTLLKYNYPSLHLIQKREMNDIVDCPEKESMIAFQDNFATLMGASRLKLQRLYFDPFFYTKEDEIAAQKVKSDFNKTLIVEDYYKRLLYNFFIAKAEGFGIVLSDRDKYYLFSDYSDGVEVLNTLISNLIVSCGGMEEFKQIIQEYNNYVVNNYLTNDQIVELSSELNNKAPKHN